MGLPFGFARSKVHNYLSISSAIKKISKRNASQLAEVGKFSTPKPNGSYETGQLFLHRVFGYRGVILFPWTTKVYSRDKVTRKDRVAEDSVIPEGREIKGEKSVFYQVLIDMRDSPYIRAQTEAVTFLGKQDGNTALFAVPCLDNVSHADVLPYSAKAVKPIVHHFFDKFLSHAPNKSPSFVGQDALNAWTKRNVKLLDLSEVHVETTENIRVTVVPFYMGSREGQSSSSLVYWWRYCVRLENLGQSTVQLRERLWRIYSQSGTLETVKGRGVIGQEPVLTKMSPAFQYSSHISLQSSSGHMWGVYRMEREDGYSFDCRIPPFSLESKMEFV